MADNDNELIAVLFHEIGHLKHRHFLRRIIQDSMVTIVFASLFGNLETADLFLVAPTLFLDAAYSRQFEIEADRFAFEKMNMHKIELSHFKSILNKLEDKLVICDIGANCGNALSPSSRIRERISCWTIFRVIL